MTFVTPTIYSDRGLNVPSEVRHHLSFELGNRTYFVTRPDQDQKSTLPSETGTLVLDIPRRLAVKISQPKLHYVIY